MPGPSRSNREARERPVGAGGKARERTIDQNVSRLAGGGGKDTDAAPTPSRGRQPPRPSSYAPSGELTKQRVFGAPMQETGKARPSK